MDISKSKSRITTIVYITIAAFSSVVFITGLFPETTVDSAKYAALARNIFEYGDFIHLKLHGEPYLQKPPLLFWLGALSFKIFGISMFAFKLPTLLFSFLGIYSVYRLGLLIYDKRTGVIAALIYSSCEAFLLYNMDVHTDLLMTSFIIFSTWQLAEYLNNKRILNFILGFVGIGLAMISKGVIGLAVPVFSIAGYLLVKKDFRTMFSLRWLLGIPVLLIILYPTFKGLYDQFGIPGLEFYFWSNNIDRIRGDYSGGRHDYSYVFHTLIYIFLPWSLYTFSTFVRDWRMWKKNSFSINNKYVAYCYSAIIILALIISVSSQQAPHYLLPIIPFLAIITARFINDIASTYLYPKTFRLMLIFRNLIVFILWILVIAVTVYFFPTKNILIWSALFTMFLLLIFSYINVVTKIQKLIIPPLISIFAMGFVANTVYMPSALKYHGPIQASYLYNKLAPDNSTLYTYNYFLFETYFYPEQISGYIGPGELKNVLSKGSCWIITDEKGCEEIASFNNCTILEQHIFPYKQLTNLSFRFLNPKTRVSSLSKIFLLKIK
jgi:4-amino-4-deoxy-L-arabinose transferase-like glycosyltransferase